MSFVTSFEKATPNLVGVKGFNLFKAKAFGFPVPNFFCVTEKPPLNDTDLLRYIEKEFPTTLKFSVRSSSSIEDGEKHSYAGQFKTFLDIEKEHLIEKIRACFETASIEEGNLYGKGWGHQHKMTVVVQEMVESEFSGVIFTANPQGILNETVIVVGEGRGDLVVEDKIPTTTYFYNQNDKTYYYEMQKDSILVNDYLDSLIELSEKLMECFGTMIDIEFAIEKKGIKVLQVRNITTLDVSNVTIVDNSNIVESYPGLSLPLTCSFVKEAYSGIFEKAIYRILKSKTLLAEYKSTFENMVVTVNGRLYYGIDNWYALLQHLPFSKKIIPVWQEMLGVEQLTHEKKVKKRIFQRGFSYINLFSVFIRTPALMKKINKTFKSVELLYEAKINSGLTEIELRHLLEEIKKVTLSNWDITLFNDMYTFIYTGLLKSQLKKHNENELVHQYISNISKIESMKPLNALIALSKSLSKNTLDRLANLKNEDEAFEFLSEGNPAAKKIEDYIILYGDRSIAELKLESITFRVSPYLLIKKIVAYGNDGDLNGDHAVFADQTPNDTLKNSPFLVKFFAKKAVIGIKNREFSRLNRTRIYGMMRNILLLLGKKFADEGLLAGPRDIFYLEMDEVRDVINHKYEMKEIVKARKEMYEEFQLIPEFSRLVFSGKPFDKHHLNINAVELHFESNTLRGIPCSGGVVEGEVLIVKDPNEVMDIKNKILVSSMTDPGWVFLLKQAKGIIAEKGSLLSHTAIISRELEKPSIVGVKNVLSQLKNGDIIRLNGTTGEINILRRLADEGC